MQIKKIRRLLTLLIFVGIVLLGLQFFRYYRALDRLDAVIAGIAPKQEELWQTRLQNLGFQNYPKKLVFRALKHEQRLDILAFDTVEKLQLMHSYPIAAASPLPGPKRKEGDNMVPEGIYALTHLNPQSNFYLSIRVDYPNELDLAYSDNPERIGSDIYIHGSDISIGCLAMTDPVIEEIFYLIYKVGLQACTLIIEPRDLLNNSELHGRDKLERQKYRRIREFWNLNAFP